MMESYEGGGLGLNITGQTVLITGGASGIGLAVAKKLARLNNQVIIAGRDPRKLEAACAEVKELIAIPCDISKEEQRLSLVSEVAERYPQLTMLINNAGIQFQSRFDSNPPSLEAIHEEMETNFVAAVRLIALMIPNLLKQPEAGIINMSSGLAIAPKAGAPIYCASKAALSAFSRSLRYQLEPTPVRVFDVLAPLVDTAMTEGRGKGKISPERFADELVAGVAKDKYVLHVGKTKYLYALSRLLPKLAFRITKNGL